MKRALLVILVLLLPMLTACGPWGPQGILAGGPLLGTAVKRPVEDWSFSDDHSIIAIESRGRWFRHSVTVLCIAHEGNLYIPSRHAPRKRWVQNILLDPRVRLEIDGSVYEGVAVRVHEVAEGVAQAFLHKYVGVEADRARMLLEPPGPGSDRAELWLFRIDPPEESS